MVSQPLGGKVVVVVVGGGGRVVVVVVRRAVLVVVAAAVRTVVVVVSGVAWLYEKRPTPTTRPPTTIVEKPERRICTKDRLGSHRVRF
jgi:hypothetical protein